MTDFLDYEAMDVANSLQQLKKDTDDMEKNDVVSKRVLQEVLKIYRKEKNYETIICFYFNIFILLFFCIYLLVILFNNVIKNFVH